MEKFTEQRSNESKWHLDKRVNVSIVFAMLSLASGFTAWAVTIDSRIAEQKVRIDNNSEAIANSEARSFRSLDAIRDSMNRINDKLDRLIERK